MDPRLAATIDWHLFDAEARRLRNRQRKLRGLGPQGREMARRLDRLVQEAERKREEAYVRSTPKDAKGDA